MMRDCRGHGPTGYCTGGRHADCPYSRGNACEHGIWHPECYITMPKGGAKVAISDPQGWGGHSAVVWPRHRYRCPCECHSDNPAKSFQANVTVVGQLALFAGVPA